MFNSFVLCRVRRTALLVWLAALSAVATVIAQPAVDHSSNGGGDGTRVAELPVKVAMTDGNVRLVGRFDISKPDRPRCAWSASAVELKFTGTAANVVWEEFGDDRLQIVVDDKPAGVLTHQKGRDLYNIAEGLGDGPHTIWLVKRTEALVGVAQFAGFELSGGGKTLPIEAPAHRIEVIGDSISCGYGNEGKSQNEHFSAATENAYMTYGAIAAREMAADYLCVAWSGKQMYPRNTIGALYDRTLPNDNASLWEFTRYQPDVVVIALGTNDYSANAFNDGPAWVKGYADFVAHVHIKDPNAMIYLATSPMLGDGWDKNRPQATLKKYLQAVIDERATAGDTKVKLIEFATQGGKNGIGSDWHPTIKTHQVMAKLLSETIAHDLGWQVKGQ